MHTSSVALLCGPKVLTPKKAGIRCGVFLVARLNEARLAYATTTGVWEQHSKSATLRFDVYKAMLEYAAR